PHLKPSRSRARGAAGPDAETRRRRAVEDRRGAQQAVPLEAAGVIVQTVEHLLRPAPEVDRLLVDAEDDKTLAGCARLLADPERPLPKTLEALLSTRHDPGLDRGWIDPHR